MNDTAQAMGEKDGLSSIIHFGFVRLADMSRGKRNCHVPLRTSFGEYPDELAEIFENLCPKLMRRNHVQDYYNFMHGDVIFLPANMT